MVWKMLAPCKHLISSLDSHVKRWWYIFFQCAGYDPVIPNVILQLIENWNKIK